MSKAFRQIAACAVVLLAICAVCRLVFFRSYTAIVSLPLSGGETLQAAVDQPEVAQIQSMESRSGYLRVTVRPRTRGEATIAIRDSSGEVRRQHYLRVGPLHTVFDLQTGGFTGDTVIIIAVTLFWLAVSAIMLRHYRTAGWPGFYSYTTIYCAGFFLFSLVTGLVMLAVTIQHLTRPLSYSMMAVYSAINSASRQFMMLTTPLILVFAIAMAISNLALLRHEKLRLKNVLGIFISAFLVLGEALGSYLFSRDFIGSEWESRINNTVLNVAATVFVYFECMLAGSVICGVKAARHQPAMDKDFIIILGCWFRRDGSLPPLLRGRVDKALDFWRRQKAATGKEATLIPSGGRGPDESMPEAEAMRRYLLQQGFPEALILPEASSRNTYQNMAYSRSIIQNVNPAGRAVFVTTNYHVFRSGVWAAQAGLPAEGIASRTRWWYWPNAFMRECLDLMVNRWKQELLMLLALNVFFGVLSMVLG